MTLIPDFTKIALDTASRAGASGAAPATKPIWDTPEGIAVKPVYTAADTAGLDTMTGMHRAVPARAVSPRDAKGAWPHDPVTTGAGGTVRLTCLDLDLSIAEVYEGDAARG